MDIAGRRLSNGDLAVGAGLILAVIFTFLPWYSVSASFGGFSSSSSVNATAYWSGWLYFIIALLTLAFFVVRTFVPTVEIPALPVADSVLYMIAGGLMVLMVIIWLLAGGGTSASGAGFSAGPGFALWLGLVVAAVVVGGGFLKRQDAQPVTRPLGSQGGYGAPPPPPPAV